MASNGFFEALGNSLWAIDKHPFRKAGDLAEETGSLELSYNPNRVFKKQEEQTFHDDGDQLSEFQRQERYKQTRLEMKFLVTELQEKQSKMRVKGSQIVRTREDIYNPFVHQRQRCMLCQDCRMFEGNFRMNSFGKANPFSCLTCACPMNGHRVIVKDKLFSSLIYNHLKDKDTTRQDIKANFFMASLTQDPSKRTTSLSKLVNLLGQGGYTVVSYQRFDKFNFYRKMAEQKLFDHKNKKTSLNKFESIYNFIQSMSQGAGKQELLSQPTSTQQDSSPLEQYKELWEQVASSVPLQNQQVLCLLLNSSESRRSLFKNFISTIQDQIVSARLVYSSGDNYTSTIDCQVFFPYQFKVHYEVFVGLGHDKKQSCTLKDSLDLNQFVIVKDGFDQLLTRDVQRAFSFCKNPQIVQCILGTQVSSEKATGLDIKITAKAGTPQLHMYGNVPPFLRFQEERAAYSVMKSLCGKMIECQRCILVMRPVLVSSGMDNLVLNLFRINGFNILGRACLIMSPGQIRLMQIFQNIAEEDLGMHTQMMNGLVQVVLVSKRMAISESNIIINGCEFGLKKSKPRLVQSQPQFRMQINNKEYIQQIPLVGPKTWQQPCLESFNGVKNLINLEQIIFGKQESQEHAQLVQASTGHVIRQAPQGVSKSRINPKLKQAILEDLNTEVFNYWMFSSMTETITEEMVNQFLPECASFQSVCVIVKPGYAHLSNQIKESLKSLKYNIIFEKTLVLPRSLAKQIVQSLFQSASPGSLKESATRYGAQTVEILCVAKESARKEMLHFLRNFALHDTGSIGHNQTLTDEALQSILVPVWREEHLVLQLFHPVLCDVERSLYNVQKLERVQLFNLLVYLAGSIVGQEVRELPIRTKIGQLSYFTLEDAQRAKTQSWYYSKVSRSSPLFVPLLFQHRQFGSITFCLQSHSGDELFKHIFRSHLQNKNTLTRGGKSLVLYLWAKKLANMVSSLSEVRPELPGYGGIRQYGQVYRGVTLDDQYKIQQTNKVRGWVKKWLGKDETIVRQLQRMLEKRGFAERCKLKNKRLLPSIRDGNLRAVKGSRVSKLILKDEIEMVDPDNELIRSAELLTIHLFNIRPEQQPKYSLWCQVYTELLRYSQPSGRFHEPAKQFLQLFIQVSDKEKFEDLQMLAIQLYMTGVERYLEGEEHLEEMLKTGLLDFKRLGRINETDDVSGKKRKYIPKILNNQEKGQAQPQLLETNNKFNEYVYNVYNDVPQPDQDSLFNKMDPLHKVWVKQRRMVNLLRDVSFEKQPRKGVYVEYQKKINQNQEEVRRKIEQQATRYTKQEEQILYDQETGNKNIWYRKKFETAYKPSGKMDNAIQKQLQKLMMFRQFNS